MEPARFEVGDLVDVQYHDGHWVTGVKVEEIQWYTGRASGPVSETYISCYVYKTSECCNSWSMEIFLRPHNPPEEIDPAYTEFKKSLDFTPVDEGVPA